MAPAILACAQFPLLGTAGNGPATRPHRPISPAGVRTKSQNDCRRQEESMPDMASAKQPGSPETEKKACWGTACNGTELADDLLHAMAEEYEEGTLQGMQARSAMASPVQMPKEPHQQAEANAASIQKGAGTDLFCPCAICCAPIRLPRRLRRPLRGRRAQQARSPLPPCGRDT